MRKALLVLVNFFILIGRITIGILITPLRIINLITSRFERKAPKIKKPIFKRQRLSFYFPAVAKYAPIIFKMKYFILGVLVSLIVVGVNQMYEFVKSLPSPRSIGKVNFASSAHLLDRNGKLLFEIYRDQNRTPIKLKELPPYVYQASIAFEDHDFFNHNGVSVISGVVRALRETYVKKELQGGSTITQQLVKNALLTPERTITRKFKEAILALWTEKLFTKKEILEMYLNQVPYGGSSYGIEEAAKTYFGVQAKGLTLSEAALLASLPQAPTLFSPYVDPQLSIRRRNEVLRKMREQGYIDEETKNKAQDEKLDILPPKTIIHAPHFVFYIKSILENLYGIQTVEEGGLKVTTSLDMDIQEEAERILKDELDRVQNLNVTNGAILVTKPGTGEILAMVGSKDYYAEPSGAFNVATALRQPGSSGKPMLYALALERNYTAASIIDDSPITYGVAGGELYHPVNYDSRFHGRVSLRSALANSYNVPAVKVLNSLGVETYVYHARKMGISTWVDPSHYGLSLALGGGEVKMTDMATAFGAFANQGVSTPLNGIIKIEDVHGRVIYQATSRKNKVIDEATAYIISDILADNEARRPAFGAHSALEVPGYKVAVKTGTTNEKKDNWTIGYTPEFLTAVWVGNNDNSPMNQALTSGITGAAPIWNRVIESVMRKYGHKAWLKKPGNIVDKKCYGRIEYFIRGKEAPCAPIIFPTPTTKPD